MVHAPSHRTAAIGLWAALLLPLALLCADFVSRETPAYSWDWGDYFWGYQQFSALIAKGGDWWTALAGSVRAADYNVSSLLPLYPFYLVFGPSRTGFITGVTLLYLVPAALLAAALAMAAAERDGERADRGQFIALAFVCITFPQFWLPTLRGLPDIIGLIPLGLATWLVLRSGFLTSDPVRNGVKIGLLIWTAFLFRRWYAYAGVGLIMATAILGAARIWLSDGERRQRFHRFLEGGKAMVLAILIALVVFQSELMARILRMSYAEAYAAYQMPLAAHLALLFERTGALHALAIAAGLGLAVVRRNAAIGLMALAALITFALFSATQAPGVQHTLPILFWLLPAAVYALNAGLRRLQGIARPAIAALAAAVCAVVLAGHVNPAARAALGPLAIVTPKATALPLQLQNEAAYQRLIAILRALSPDARIAVFASSQALNPSLLAALAPDLLSRLAEVSDVDMRDGFRIAALRADHALIADPVQLHLPAAGQQVISVPARRIVQREGFGEAYEHIAGPFSLDDGATAHLYRRVRPFDETDLAALRADLAALYPQWVEAGAYFGPPQLFPSAQR